MRVEWIGRSRTDGDNTQADPSRLVNLYRERAGDKHVLKRVPGTVLFVTLADAPMRAMSFEGGKVWTVSGTDLSNMDVNGTILSVGSVSADGNVSISGNNDKLAVAAGGEYYVYNGSALNTPSSGAFDSVGSVEFWGQRTILTELGGRRFSWSAVANAGVVNALNFATAEQRDDNIIRAVVVQGILWIMKERSIERWLLTGGDDFATPMGGGTIDTGLLAFGLMTKIPNGAFFVGNDGIAYLVSGGGMKPVSTRGVETSLVDDTPTECFYYQDEGHKFCVIRFSNRPAWIYDVVMDEWHERAEGDDLIPWSMTHSVQAFGNDYAGSAFGKIYTLERIPTDDGAPLIGRAVSRTLRLNGDRFRISRLTLEPKTGHSTLTAEEYPGLHAGGGYILATSGATGLLAGSAVTTPTDAFVSLRTSKDRGKTWSKEKRRSIGTLGEYAKVVRWRALGQFRNANFELTISDPTDITVESTAEVEVA